MDYLQITLIIVLIILAVNLIFVGVYVVLVLKSFRETVERANEVLEDVEDVTNAVSKPITSFSGIISGVTEGVKAVKSISSLMDRSNSKED
jgi:uncharacterized protein YoxC